MDETEKIIEKHLKSRFSSVIYEPDGNVPPDFLVNGRIAVEARRLNQHYREKGLEESAIPLAQKLDRLLNSIGAPSQGKSWFVWYEYQRPIPQWRSLEPKIRAVLQHVRRNGVVSGHSFEIAESFRISFLESSSPHPSEFIVGGNNDLDAGGWLIHEMIENIRFVLKRKNPVIDRMKYPEWWLLLSDHIGWSLDGQTRTEFLEYFTDDFQWDKIVIIDPRDSNNYFEIISRKRSAV